MTIEEPPTTEPVPAHAGSELVQEIRAEQRLGRAIIIGIAVAVPVNIVIWMALVTFAVNRAGSARGGPLAMAAAVGVLSGLFFGTWAGFVSTTHAFEEFDRGVDRRGPASGA